VKEILTVDETATLIHKHPVTVRHWIISKKLKARKISAGGTGVYVLLRSDVLEYMMEQTFREKAEKVKKVKIIPKDSSQVELPI
jgi:hypothetical protein